MKTVTLLLPLASAVLALDLDISNPQSVEHAASTIGANLMAYGPVAGRFPQLQPWYWWIGGAAWDTFLSYTAFTNDTQFLTPTIQQLNANVGPANDFVVLANANSEATDDQMFWTFAALDALELRVEPTGMACPATDPGCHPFLDLARNSYNDYVARWDAAAGTCGGGLPWGFQDIASNRGQLNYKNAITNGGFFQIAARLARYTGEPAYAQRATQVWDWMAATGLITADGSVLDGADKTTDCKSLTPLEWSYNTGVLVYGAAAMADYTHGQNATWTERVAMLTDAAIAKFTGPVPEAPGVLFERQNDCELQGKCNTDQKTFKGYLARWLGRAASLCPKVQERIRNVLEASATGLAKTCTGGAAETSCGTQWWTGAFNGQVEPSQDLAAFDVVVALLGIEHPPSVGFQRAW